jgi:hypothetical protein
LRSAAAELPAQGIKLQHLAAAHGPAGLGSLLILLAAPCLLPVPGVGTVLGLGLLGLAMKLWRGDSERAHKLPKELADFGLSKLWATRVLHLMARFYAQSGRWTRRRLTDFTDGSPSRFLSAKVALMAALIILPIPFGNLLPALALMLLGLGLVARDGLAVLAGAAMATLALLFSVLVGAAAWFWGLGALELARQISTWLLRQL